LFFLINDFILLHRCALMHSPLTPLTPLFPFESSSFYWCSNVTKEKNK
jgi:hypothetical protein